MVTLQIKDVISPFSQGLWIPNLVGYWLFCGCYDRGLSRRKLNNSSISLFLSLVVKKGMLYQMLKKPRMPRDATESLCLPKKQKKPPKNTHTKMLIRTKSVEMNKIVTNSEIHLHHCLCESRGFETGRSSHRRCSIKKVFLKILQN